MADVVLSLGTNLGDRASNMRRMEQALAQVLEAPLVVSSLMETEPVGVSEEQPWYYNRLIKGGYRETARKLLLQCQAIEQSLGRTRERNYASRTADIDIILFGAAVVETKDLTIPHRHIRDRRFLIEGLREIAGERILPGESRSIAELAEEMEPEIRGQRICYIESV